MKTGILLHGYRVDTVAWEELIWGKPAENCLGVGTKLIECLLQVPLDQDVVAIVHSGTSEKDGMTESEYTRKYILDRLDSMGDFPRLRAKLGALSEQGRAVFHARLRGLVAGPIVQNTVAELTSAVQFFAAQQVEQVIQIAAATHAPRCMREQAAARSKGLIPLEQPWYMVASDISYQGARPEDVVIAEPLHRRDNALYDFKPSWVDITKRYPLLSLENKKQLLQKMDEITATMLAEQPRNTEVAN